MEETLPQDTPQPTREEPLGKRELPLDFVTWELQVGRKRDASDSKHLRTSTPPTPLLCKNYFGPGLSLPDFLPRSPVIKPNPQPTLRQKVTNLFIKALKLGNP